jgi:hypothetical protein
MLRPVNDLIKEKGREHAGRGTSRQRDATATAHYHCGLFFCLFCILGVGGFVLFWMPLICGVPTATGVGAFTGPSSSVLTADARLRLVPLFWDGDVLALGPLEVVPC